MENIKSPGKTLMKASGYVFATGLILLIVLSTPALTGVGFEGIHSVVFIAVVIPIVLALFLSGLIMHSHLKTRLQILRAQAEQERQP